ncbi:MAG: hypothetical protein ABIR00_01330 [Nitrosospira sp.]
MSQAKEISSGKTDVCAVSHIGNSTNSIGETHLLKMPTWKPEWLEEARLGPSPKSEFIPGVDVRSIMSHQLTSPLVGEIDSQPASFVDAGQFGPLALRVRDSLASEIGTFGVGRRIDLPDSPAVMERAPATSPAKVPAREQLR